MSFYLPNNQWRRVAQDVGAVTIKAIGAVRVHFSDTEPTGSEGNIYAYRTHEGPYSIDGQGLDMWVLSADVGEPLINGFRSAVWVEGTATLEPDDVLPKRQFPTGQVADHVFTLSSTATTPNGDTVTFSEPVEVAYDILGSILIRAPQSGSFTIDSFPPNAATDGSGYSYNGTMLNMQQAVNKDVPYTQLQGYDEQAEIVVVKNTQQYPYGNTVTFPFTVDAATRGTLRRSVRVDPLTTTAQIERFDDITIFSHDQFVPENPVAPAYNDPTATVTVWEGLIESRPYISDASFDAGLTRTEALDAVARLCLISASHEADNFRRIHVTEQGGYGAQWGVNYGEAFAYLHSTASDADKDELFWRFIKMGVDTLGLIRNESYVGFASAGQFGGTLPAVALLALSVSDQTIYNDLVLWETNSNEQAGWYEAEHVGNSAAWPFGGRYNHTTVVPEQVGEVRWKFTQQPSKQDAQLTGLDSPRYAGTNAAQRMWETLCVGVMPGGVEFLRGGLPSDTTNDRAANIWVTDQQAYCYGFGAVSFRPGDARIQYVASRHLIPLAGGPNRPWPATPEFATGGNGVVDVDLSGWLDLARQAPNPVLEAQVRISQDNSGNPSAGEVYDLPIGPSDTGILSIPTPPGQVYVTMRSRNVNGWGLWSYTHPHSDGDSDRSLVTVSDAGVDRDPVLVGTPVNSYKPYVHPTRYYLDIASGATVPDDVAEIIGSFGQVDMNPWADPVVDLVVDGVDYPRDSALIRTNADLMGGETCSIKFTFTHPNSSSTLVVNTPNFIGGGATYGAFYPEGTVGQTPSNIDHLWDDGSNTLLLESSGRVEISGGGGSLPSLFVPNDLVITGPSGNLVPEGQAVFKFKRANSGSTRNVGIVIRASGTSAATADGVSLELSVSAVGVDAELHRIIAGASQGVQTYSMPDAGFIYDVLPVRDSYLDFYVRFEWEVVAGDLVVRGKVWRPDDYIDDEDALIGEGVDEPSTWGFEHTFTGVPSGTTVGIGGFGTFNKELYPVAFGPLTSGDLPILS